MKALAGSSSSPLVISALHYVLVITLLLLARVAALDEGLELSRARAERFLSFFLVFLPFSPFLCLCFLLVPMFVFALVFSPWMVGSCFPSGCHAFRLPCDMGIRI